MIHPNVAHRTAVAEVNEVPVVLVVIALARLVPFPHLVEFQIAHDDVRRAFEIERRVFDCRAVRGKNRQPALRLDVNQAHAGREQTRMQLRRVVRTERRRGKRLHRTADFVPAEVEVRRDFDDLHRTRSFIGGNERRRQIQRVCHLDVSGIIFRDHAAAGREIREAGQVECRKRQRRRNGDGERRVAAGG